MIKYRKSMLESRVARLEKLIYGKRNTNKYKSEGIFYNKKADISLMSEYAREIANDLTKEFGRKWNMKVDKNAIEMSGWVFLVAIPTSLTLVSSNDYAGFAKVNVKIDDKSITVEMKNPKVSKKWKHSGLFPDTDIDVKDTMSFIKTMVHHIDLAVYDSTFTLPPPSNKTASGKIEAFTESYESELYGEQLDLKGILKKIKGISNCEFPTAVDVQNGSIPE